MNQTTQSDVPAFLLALATALFCFWIYFVPSIAAYRTKHHQFTAIVCLNTLAGWTFVGWIAALVWALTKPHVVLASRPGQVEGGETLTARNSAEKVCPRCAERVKMAAIVCRYCGYEFEESLDGLRAPEISGLDEPALKRSSGTDKYKGIAYTLLPDYRVEVRIDGKSMYWPSLFEFRRSVDRLTLKS